MCIHNLNEAHPLDDVVKAISSSLSNGGIISLGVKLNTKHTDIETEIRLYLQKLSQQMEKENVSF
jgi:hypothetical protein